MVRNLYLDTQISVIACASGLPAGVATGPGCYGRIPGLGNSGGAIWFHLSIVADAGVPQTRAVHPEANSELPHVRIAASISAGPDNSQPDGERLALLRHIGLLHDAEQTARFGIWSWDIASDAGAWSLEVFQILGLNRETFTPNAEAFFLFIHEEDLNRVKIAHERSLLTGEPLSYTARIRRPDGTIRWIESQGVPSIMDGEVVGMVGTVLDITDCQLAQTCVAEGQQRFEALVQQVSDLIVVLNSRGRVSYVSPSLERLFGYRPVDVLGLDSESMVHPDDQALSRWCFSQIRQPGASARTTCRIRAANGQWRTMEIVFTNLLHEPAVRGYVLNARDDSERAETEARLRASEERYRLIVETAAEGVWAVDASGATAFVNQRMADLLGSSVDELMRATIFDFVSDEDRPGALCRAEQRRQGTAETSYDFRLRRADGTELWVLVSGSDIRDHDGRFLGALAMMTDITARKQAEEELVRSTRQLNAAQRLSMTGSWDQDLEKGTVLRSDEYIRLMGFPPDVDDSVSLLLTACHPDDRERITMMRERAMQGGRVRGEFRVVRPDGSVRVMRTAMEGWLDSKGTPVRLTGTVQDITEQRRLEEQLKRQALHDRLTGLANRGLFVDRLQQALKRRQRTRESLSLLFVDLDDFKTINDSLGHGAGDEILVGAARRLQAALRPSDTAARFGGDEFAVLLEGTDESEAAGAARRVLTALEEPFLTQGREVIVRASVGIAVAEEDLEPEQLLRDADAAMYAAKRQPRAPRYRVFESSMHTAARHRLDLRAGLERAVDQGEFEPFYQPFVRLADGVIAGVEALVRWNHPGQGLISPAEFIPQAEEFGLIVPIGEAVLREATRRIGELNHARDGDPLSLAVNLSARQLVEADFLDIVEDALRVSGLQPDHLVLEVTESVLIEEGGTVVPVLAKLRDRGIKVAIDDFGTGYSSLSYLRRLPVDHLKIDRAFVTEVTESAEDAAVAQAVVRLADVLKLATLGEGIETPEQAQALLEIGCTYGQGYLFSRPLPGPELEKVLANDELCEAWKRVGMARHPLTATWG